jgi:putative transposase
MSRSLRLLDTETGVVEVSSRTLHGRFLMRPSAKVNELILGVLGRAQRSFDVELFAFVFLSNHFHALMRVLSAEHMAGFMGYLKGNIAKELGRLFGWEEKFWGRRYHSASVADSEQAQAARFFYILANGCKEGLVASPLDWPGVSSASALYRGESTLEGTWYDRTAEYRARIRGERRTFPYPETVRLSPLPFLAGLTSLQQRKYVVDAVQQVEAETRERHEKNGSRPLGVRDVLKQHPHQKPEVFLKSPAPLFLTATREEYWRMRAAREATVAAYRNAAERLRRGETDVRFPVGSFPPPAPFVRMRAPP